jgi:hypothetical protein
MIKSDALDRMTDAYAASGIACDGPFEASRRTGDGTLLRWRLLAPQPSRFGKLAPIVIDWADSPHPAAAAPGGCRLEHFGAGAPDAAALADLYRGLDADIPVQRADRSYLRAVLATPAGELVLTSS